MLATQSRTLFDDFLKDILDIYREEWIVLIGHRHYEAALVHDVDKYCFHVL